MCAILILLQPVITCTSVEVLLIVRKELFTGSFIDAEKIVVAHEAVSMMVASCSITALSWQCLGVGRIGQDLGNQGRKLGSVVYVQQKYICKDGCKGSKDQEISSRLSYLS